MDTVDTCISCGNTEFTYITDVGDKFTEEKVWMCDSCGLVFLSPRMSAIYDYYYENDFSTDFRGEETPGDDAIELADAIAQFRWNSLQPYVKEDGKLLEIGCGMGQFVKKSSEVMDSYGLDPSTGYAEFHEDLNIKVATFPEFSFEDEVDKFDIICVFHVLEHVADPVAFLEKVNERLAADGILYLEYPDIAYAARRAYLADTYFQKSHLYDFSAVSLVAILSATGFYMYSLGNYEEYPRDKNVIAIIKKLDEPHTVEIAPNVIERLRNSLLVKVKNVRYIQGDTPLNVCHIASHNINVGDGAITAGIRKFLQDIPVNLNITNFDIVDFNRRSTHITAEELNKINADLIIVGGGGTIDGHKSRIYTGTALQMPIYELEKVKAPMAFWGLGHNVFRNQPQYNLEILNNFILFCKSRGYPFSVRRDQSKLRMSSFLSEAALEYTQEVADPGFFVPVDGISYALNPDPQRHNAILQIALDSTKHRFGEEDQLEEFMMKILDLIPYLIDQHETDVTLALHTLADAQVTMIYKVILDDHTMRNKLRLNSRLLGVPHPIYAPYYFANYANADLVIGMRGHSVICGTGLRVPTIALSTHDKVAGYMDEINCSEWCFDVDFDYDELVAAVDGILSIEAAIRQKGIIMEATDDWAAESRNFAYQCLNIV